MTDEDHYAEIDRIVDGTLPVDYYVLAHPERINRRLLEESAPEMEQDLAFRRFMDVTEEVEFVPSPRTQRWQDGWRWGGSWCPPWRSWLLAGQMAVTGFGIGWIIGHYT